MKMLEMQKLWCQGKIDKKIYWMLMRENYTCILPQIQSLIQENKDCQSITISENGCILEKRNGVKLYFDFSQSVCRAEAELLMGEDPEKEDMAYVNQYLLKNPCQTVLDIGANAGLFSLELYQQNSHLTYHVFEPLPSTFQKLADTAALNHADTARYIIHNTGLSDKAGIFDFYLPAASEAASLRPVDDAFYLKESSPMGEYTGAQKLEKISCSVDTVDHFAAAHTLQDIGFIKIDTEGNEKFVLEGAVHTLQTHRPLVYCELLRKHAKRFGYHPNEVIGFMKKLGYACQTIRNGILTGIEEITEQTAETNFFFAHAARGGGKSWCGIITVIRKFTIDINQRITSSFRNIIAVLTGFCAFPACKTPIDFCM